MNPGPVAAAEPRKRVLVLQYSQTGQLAALADRFVAPLREDPRIELHVLRLEPQRPFPFPWRFFDFLDAFPESAHLVPPPLHPIGLDGTERFDLVVLPYQVWFLAPSQPVTAFLRDPVARRVLRDTPVVALVACRNMWMSAYDKLRALLADAGARLVDHVVYTDPGPTLATFVTTPRWLLTGRRGGFAGLPAAGLSDEQIRGAARFGRALRDALAQGLERGPGPLLAGLGAVRVDPRLAFSERVGTRSFHLWGKLVMAAGRPGARLRRPVLLLYVTFLVLAIATLVPASLVLQALLRPFMARHFSTITARFEQPSGSSRERLPVYGD